jgi:hypothetical protein
MQKRLIAILAILALSSITFACSSDDDGDDDPGTAGSGGTGGTGGSGGTGGTGGIGGSGGTGGTGGTGDVCDFEPCGGNPAGTWSAASTCALTVQDFGDDPACQDLPFQFTVDVSGTLTYANNAETSTLVFDQYESVYTLPIDCAAALGAIQQEPMSAEEFCAGWSDTLDYYQMGSCTWDATDGCTCTQDQSGDWSWQDDPYEVRDNSLIFQGQDGEVATDFCVQGNVQQQDWGDFILVLNKQ